MGAGANRNPGAIDDGRDIVRMGAFDLEGNDRALVRGGAEDPQRIDLAQPLGGMLEQAPSCDLIRALPIALT